MYISCMYDYVGIHWDSIVLPGYKEYTMGSALLASEPWSLCLLWWQRNHHTLQVRSPSIRLEAVLLVALGEISVDVRKDCESIDMNLHVKSRNIWKPHMCQAAVQRVDVPSSLANLRYSYPEERSIKDKEGIEWWPQHVKDASTHPHSYVHIYYCIYGLSHVKYRYNYDVQYVIL